MTPRYTDLSPVIADIAALRDGKASTAHKSSHATGGTDALTPADIGAVEAFQIQGNPPETNIAPAAMELRDNEDLGVALKIDSSTQEKWFIEKPEEFRVAIGAATTEQGAKADSALQPVKYVGAFNPSIAYEPNDVVLWDGALYRNIGAGPLEMPIVNDEDWAVFGPQMGVAPLSGGLHDFAQGHDALKIIDSHVFLAGQELKQNFREAIEAAKTADVQIFRTTSSTWIKPAGAKICEFQCIGGGGGGGCGAKVSASTAVYGGLGGSSGGHSRILISASELNDAEYTVTVGAGGNGAVFGVSAALAGGASFVAGVTDGRIAGVTANGIASNGGVSVPANTYGGIPNGNISGAASINATAGQGGNLNYSPPAGGAGGGCGSSNSQYPGGASSNVYLSLTGAGGTAGGGHGGNQPAKSGKTSLLFNGTGGGGGGGASTSNTNGGNGANATGYGCGGGGGGSCSNASPALVGGNGGKGGNGVVVIITYF